MWIVTPEGYYSLALAKDGSGRLVVRSRVRKDLVRLRKRIRGLKIIKDGGTDYEYRTFVTKEQAAPVFGELVYDIDYTNFKDEVKRRQGYERADIYMDVWEALLRLDPRHYWHDYKADPLPPLEDDDLRRAA